jgi:uncharacterized damage-inducible protein DinB
MNALARPYRDLLAYQLAETRRWHAWLAERPHALALRIGEGAVRDLAAHVAVVDLAYVQRLRGMAVTQQDPQAITPWSEVGALAERAAALLDDWLLAATPAEFARVLCFRGMTAQPLMVTARDVVMHVLLHGARHWAQIAAFLRQQGLPQDWPHDYLLRTPVPE